VALAANANGIITGSFCNISSVCDFLIKKKSNVMLACAAWKNRVNIEDTLFAGAVINRIKQHFDINCDATLIAESLYLQANGDLLNFMKEKNASHYHRLMNFGLEEDIKFCLTEDIADILSIYSGGRLIAG
jgi:2-phosphosulfolactate phosphatase